MSEPTKPWELHIEHGRDYEIMAGHSRPATEEQFELAVAVLTGQVPEMVAQWQADLVAERAATKAAIDALVASLPAGVDEDTRQQIEFRLIDDVLPAYDAARKAAQR